MFKTWYVHGQLPIPGLYIAVFEVMDITIEQPLCQLMYDMHTACVTLAKHKSISDESGPRVGTKS